MTYKKFTPSESFIPQAERPVDLQVIGWGTSTGQQESAVAKGVWDGKTPTAIYIRAAEEAQQ